MAAKECPWCGESMKLQEREAVDRIPGTSQTRKKKVVEWVCPACDHFEDADPSEPSA